MCRPTTSPRVVATSTCPTTRSTSEGSSGCSPATSATTWSGSVATGSTRPWAPSSAPTQSRPVTMSPVSSHIAVIRRLPSECPARSPSPPNRCCTTRLHVRPHVSSPQSAARAIRRSPGGSTSNCARSRPLDPPSSDTATTAVRSSVTRRRALRVAASPWPPPTATTREPVERGPGEGRRPGAGAVTRDPGRGARRAPRRRPSPAARPGSPPSRRSGACHRCSRSRP